MKRTYINLYLILILPAVLALACGRPGIQTGAPKVQADITFTGVIESMDGTGWVVNKLPVSVDPSVVRDGPYTVGDIVKVEADLEPDGTIVALSIQRPSADDLATATAAADNSNDANGNDGNFNDNNENDDNADDDENSNDGNSNDDDDNSND